MAYVSVNVLLSIFSVRIVATVSGILTEALRGFPQSLQIKAATIALKQVMIASFLLLSNSCSESSLHLFRGDITTTADTESSNSRRVTK